MACRLHDKQVRWEPITNLDFVIDAITNLQEIDSKTKKKPKANIFFPNQNSFVLFCASIERFIVCCELEAVFVEYNPVFESPCFPIKIVSLRATEMWNNLPYCMEIWKGKHLNASRNKFNFLVSAALSRRKSTCAVFPRYFS